MADANDRREKPEQEERLKYLEFVKTAASKAVVCVSGLYGSAKKNSGLLRPGVETVEGTVKTVVGPVYQSLHTVPLQLLSFVDRKVDEAISKVDGRVPPIVKEASIHVCWAAQKAPVVAREVATEVRRDGVVGAASGLAKTVYFKCEPVGKELYAKYEPVGKELYAKYEPVAERYAVTTWRTLHRLPLFPHVAQIVIPSAAYWSERYNDIVRSSTNRGYAVSSYLPVIPVDKIAKVFSEREHASGEGVGGTQ
ncbi:Stress-related protein [Nymphaea thermarum]|nr:Stress-related protein [Nymphaea thermarum]